MFRTFSFWILSRFINELYFLVDIICLSKFLPRAIRRGMARLDTLEEFKDLRRWPNQIFTLVYHVAFGMDGLISRGTMWGVGCSSICCLIPARKIRSSPRCIHPSGGSLLMAHNLACSTIGIAHPIQVAKRHHLFNRKAQPINITDYALFLIFVEVVEPGVCKTPQCTRLRTCGSIIDLELLKNRLLIIRWKKIFLKFLLHARPCPNVFFSLPDPLILDLLPPNPCPLTNLTRPRACLSTQRTDRFCRPN